MKRVAASIAGAIAVGLPTSPKKVEKFALTAERGRWDGVRLFLTTPGRKAVFDDENYYGVFCLDAQQFRELETSDAWLRR